ncbi:hypothetical protein [Micromonospora sp. URMC 103]|uniref:hypothetical protein n=1 Tax=Micromonospora sp. URMC 103 TaxID=3423406 RepID=UPI003F1C1DB5
MSTRRITGSALLCLVLTGCATAADPPGPGLREHGPPRVEDRWTSCADAGAETRGAAPPTGTGATVLPLLTDTGASTLPLLDDTFTPVAAVLCGQQPTPRPGGGTDLVAIERRADEVTELAEALRLPDEARAAGPCTADMVVPPWLALLDERGRWLRPGIPRDGCGKPRPEVREALDRLRPTIVGTRRLAEIESAEAAAAGCVQRWADMIAVHTATGSPAPPGPARIAPGAALRLCVYRVPSSERGSAKPAGEFAYGRVLSHGENDAVIRTLAATGPATRCTTPAGRFALLRPTGGTGTDVYAELDGCLRVLVVPPSGAPTLGRADPALAALLR